MMTEEEFQLFLKKSLKFRLGAGLGANLVGFPAGPNF